MRALASLLLLAACHRDETPMVRRDPVTAPAPIVKLVPVTITPAVPPFVTGMMDHADVLGWSTDGARFGYCVTDGGLGARRCELLSRTGHAEKLDDLDPSTHDVDPARTAALDARIAKLGLSVRRAEWSHGDVEIVWQVVEGDSMHKPPTRGVLRVGTRVRGGPTVHALELTGSSEWHHHIHPEAIALSPDGQTLGVIAHAFGGEFSDEHVAVVKPVAELVGNAH